ncbi:hypothetical protein LJC58_05375 [Lachnospiraceae bacterium OttesenSCG-928-D06]|nr:hypothetical protein [Lachnospiraceae bacterium OttesenSCG-928-D06]
MSKKWYIWLDGKEIPVTEEVYRTYKRAEWREEKQDVVRAARECSYDFMLENDFDGQADTNQKLVDEIVEDKLLLDILLEALCRGIIAAGTLAALPTIHTFPLKSAKMV